MLVLTRKQNEKIRIGDNITITVVRMKGKSVRIGIEAPNSINVLRGELVFAEAGNDGDIHSEPSAAEQASVASEQAASDTIIEARIPRASRLMAKSSQATC